MSEPAELIVVPVLIAVQYKMGQISSSHSVYLGLHSS